MRYPIIIIIIHYFWYLHHMIKILIVTANFETVNPILLNNNKIIEL